MNKSRTKAASMALARVLSDKCLLPTSAVEDVTAFHRVTNRINIDQTLSALNEIIPVDTTAVLDYVERFYKFRYHSAFPQRQISAFQEETAVEDFFGLGFFFGKECIAIIQKESASLCVMVSGFTSVIADMKG